MLQCTVSDTLELTILYAFPHSSLLLFTFTLALLSAGLGIQDYGWLSDFSVLSGTLPRQTTLQLPKAAVLDL